MTTEATLIVEFDSSLAKRSNKALDIIIQVILKYWESLYLCSVEEVDGWAAVCNKEPLQTQTF